MLSGIKQKTHNRTDIYFQVEQNRITETKSVEIHISGLRAFTYIHYR